MPPSQQDKNVTTKNSIDKPRLLLSSYPAKHCTSKLRANPPIMVVRTFPVFHRELRKLPNLITGVIDIAPYTVALGHFIVHENTFSRNRRPLETGIRLNVLYIGLPIQRNNHNSRSHLILASIIICVRFTSNSSYLVSLHPDLTKDLHSWGRDWS